MPDDARKLPPEFDAKARRLDAALEAYTQKMDVLKKERKGIMQRFMKRVEALKIEEAKKRIQSL